jgi:hypothetical protein
MTARRLPKDFRCPAALVAYRIVVARLCGSKPARCSIEVHGIDIETTEAAYWAGVSAHDYVEGAQSRRDEAQEKDKPRRDRAAWLDQLKKVKGVYG